MPLITVYGASWCDDTNRSLRHLRRLGVPHRFRNVDEDLDALERAIALNGGVRRTPTIDLGLGGEALVEPDNDTLTAALVEVEMLSPDEATERLGVQNVGDIERVARGAAGLGLMALASARGTPAPVRWALRLGGLGVIFTGLTGWCPLFQAKGVTSLGGPADRPDETARGGWLAPAPTSAVPEVSE